MTGNPDPQRVLVTGSAGTVGRAVCRELQARGHHVRGLDIQPTPHVGDALVGSMTDPALVKQAMTGMHTVIHLAAIPREDDFVETLVPNNVVGLYQVFETAVKLKPRRLIYASSVQVVFGFKDYGRTICIEDGPAPTNHYGLLKLWGEQMGEMFWRLHGLPFLGVRLGWCVHELEDLKKVSKDGPVENWYLSHRDAGRFFACAVEAESIDCAIVFATSHSPAVPAYDLQSARRLIGYEPLDVYPEGTPYPDAPTV